MKTLAVLYICTGAYVAFWRDFYPNFKANFLPDCDRTFFVFTDAHHIAYEDAPDVRRIPQQALPWPERALVRGELDDPLEPELGGASRAFADIGSHWCDLAEFVSGLPA